MASAWGKAWGVSWGKAWGSVAPAPTSTASGGGGRRGRESAADLRALVEAKWEVIEAARKADAIVAEEPRLPLARVEVAKVAQVAAVDVAAAPALLPGAAQRARDARRRDDEDALILLLLES